MCVLLAYLIYCDQLCLNIFFEINTFRPTVSAFSIAIPLYYLLASSAKSVALVQKGRNVRWPRRGVGAPLLMMMTVLTLETKMRRADRQTDGQISHRLLFASRSEPRPV